MSEKDQRATLEAKDRDELLTIASTLGGKPGSRAKKAEVIDLILGLIADSEPAPPKPRRGRPLVGDGHRVAEDPAALLRGGAFGAVGARHLDPPPQALSSEQHSHHNECDTPAAATRSSAAPPGIRVLA